MTNIEKTCNSFNAWKSSDLIKYNMKNELVYERYYKYDTYLVWNETQIKNEMLIYYGEIISWNPNNLEELKMLV